MRAVSSSSPSVNTIPPDHPVTVHSVRPHAHVAAGVSVFARYDPLDLPEGRGSLDPAPPNSQRPQMERIRRIRFDIARDVLSRRPDLLEEGAPATFGELRQLVRASQYLFVKPAAVELLARRDHSKAELLRKLQRRGFSRSVAEDAVDELQETGWQDDRRAAESWVRSMMRGSGRSRAYLLAGLAERGHSRDVAAGAVQAYEEENPGCFGRALQTQMEKIVRSIGSENQLTERQRKTVISRLMRRGFSTTEIQQHFH